MDTVKKIEIYEGGLMTQSVVFTPADGGRLVETYRPAMGPDGHRVKVYEGISGTVATVTTHTTSGNRKKYFLFG